MTEPYDSTPDTVAHITRVQELIEDVRERLEQRQLAHDDSKLRDPEKAAFDVLTPRLKGLDYGSDAYRACLKEMRPALEHHYAHNSHHPEHYPNGVSGMSLLDVVEMLMDWKAASERHATGSIRQSLVHNTERFQLSEQLRSILANTIAEMGWDG